MAKLINFVLVLALSVLAADSLLAQTQPTSEEKEIVFQISDPLRFKGRIVSGSLRKSEIAGLLELPVRNGSSDMDKGYGVEMTSANNEKVMVYTCRKWKKALDEKAYSASTFDMSMESSLIRTCGLLFALQNAKLPLKSFVANPRVTLANLNLLPAEILSANTDDQEKEKEHTRGVTLLKAVARKDITKSEAPAAKAAAAASARPSEPLPVCGDRLPTPPPPPSSPPSTAIISDTAAFLSR